MRERERESLCECMLGVGVVNERERGGGEGEYSNLYIIVPVTLPNKDSVIHSLAPSLTGGPHHPGGHPRGHDGLWPHVR